MSTLLFDGCSNCIKFFPFRQLTNHFYHLFFNTLSDYSLTLLSITAIISPLDSGIETQINKHLGLRHKKMKVEFKE